MASGVNDRYRRGSPSGSTRLAVIDAHAHLFTPSIMRSMARRPQVLAELRLEVSVASARLDPAQLDRSAAEAGVRTCLLLPTAPPDGVEQANELHRRAAAAHPRLVAASTLHPEMADLAAAIEAALARRPHTFKLSSFTQRFAPLGDAALAMFARIEEAGGRDGRRPVVVLDTYTRAADHFRCEQAHVTTPPRLARLVRTLPGIDWVGAHMGGLAADPDELRRELSPAHNLYLDTSNAAHVLPGDAFVALLRDHGAGHVLFGTDWPWFGHGGEIPHIRALLERAGFDEAERAGVFAGNASKLHGI